MAQQKFQFEIYRGGQLVDTKQEDGSVSFKIGSHDRSHIFFDDPEVSRVHAMIEFQNGAAFITDLGSGRGTFVNERRINKSELKSGDRIRVGTSEIVFSVVKESRRAAGRVAVPAAPKSVEYARRFLARPAKSDGTVEYAHLWKDLVLADEFFDGRVQKRYVKGLVRVSSKPKAPVNMTMGEAQNSTVPIQDSILANKPDFVVVSNATENAQTRLRFLPDMEGELYVGADRYTFREAAAAGIARPDGDAVAVPFDKDVRARFVFGHQTVFIHKTAKPAAAFPIPWAMSREYMAAIAAAFTLLFGIVLIGFWMPPDYSMNRSDDFLLDQRFVNVMLQDELPPEPELPDWMKEEEDDSAIVAGEAGEAGDEREQETDNRGTIGSDQGAESDPQLARADAREQALQTGALAALASYTGGSAFGVGAGSYTDVVAIGGADGVNIGASYGVGGLGAYGGGAATGSAIGGGGGFGIGPSAINRGAAGAGRSGVGIRDREERQVAVVPGRSEIQGQLDRELIERVIRQHRREIVSCYETELQRNPTIEGRVTVSFVIDPSGQVARSGIGSTTLNNKNVEECITLRVRRWRFPEPKGGGIVTVNYPFTFVSGN